MIYSIMRKPSNNPITMPFGSTDPPYSVASPHRGTDFGYIPDNVIYAPFSGKVRQIPMNGNDGNGSYMTDSDGRFHGMLHASSYLVPANSTVQEGQPIAVMGETGLAQGVHCHWAVKQNGQFIDPMSLISEGEEMFNEGDRVNLNVYLYGEDKGFFKSEIGKDFKSVVYGFMVEGSEFDSEYKINEGDVVNMNNLLGTTDADTMKRQIWKKFSYSYLPQHLPSGVKPEPLPKGIYEVK